MLRSLVGSEMCIRDSNPRCSEDRLRRGLFFDDDGLLHSWNLTMCDLDRLPDSFGRMRVVGSVDLSYNGLSGLPETVGELVVGGNLHLRDNMLRSLPASFGQMKVGGYVSWRNNFLSDLPPSAFKTVW
eukprot:TRINITY_DN63085_c0_g1_i1.p2 TRINITY_DN63085_c0_g1~~TRINITY_DN63085_c0_g1_i1.p2  ORF type:complete len:128 (+),score=17.94 TRINITY_DN63085_c0_g1_i1:111-494(+)